MGNNDTVVWNPYGSNNYQFPAQPSNYFYVPTQTNDRNYFDPLGTASFSEPLQERYPSPSDSMPEGTDIEVLLLGPTGSGKSTFLNMAANYFLSGSFGVNTHEQQDLKVIIPTRYLSVTEGSFSHSEHNVKNQAKSQTKKAMRYQLSVNGRTITFIDTPGMGDTSGIDKDNDHLTEILTKAAKGKKSKLSGIILFFNGTEARDTATKIYAFNKLKGVIPDVALKNMIVVLTSTWKESSTFSIDPILELGIPRNRIMYMNNSVFAVDPRRWSETGVAKRLTSDWDDSMATMSQICAKLSANSHAINSEFRKMLEIRDFIMSELHKVRLQFADMENAQATIETFTRQYQSKNAVAENFKDFAQKAKVITTKFVPNNKRHYSTVCQVHHTICHDECSLNETVTVGDQIFTGCAAFTSKDGLRCKTCSSNESCSYKNHYHARGKFEIVEETLQDRLEEYKKRYQKASKAAKNAKNEITSAEGAVKQLKETLDKFTEEVKIKLEELKKICSGYNFVAELNSTIKLLKEEAQGYTSTEVLNSANDFIAFLELLANQLTESKKDKTSPKACKFDYESDAEDEQLEEPKSLLTIAKNTTRSKTRLSFIKNFGRKKKSTNK